MGGVTIDDIPILRELDFGGVVVRKTYGISFVFIMNRILALSLITSVSCVPSVNDTETYKDFIRYQYKQLKEMSENNSFWYSLVQRRDTLLRKSAPALAVRLVTW